MKQIAPGNDLPTKMTGAAAAEPASFCSERERLVYVLVVATLDYSRAVMVIQERAGVMKKDHYRRIRGYVDKARTRLEEARRALERHASEHGC